MLEIGLRISNEMMKYEPLMDEYRTLILAYTSSTDRDPRVFNFIEEQSLACARDILNHNRISDSTVSTLLSKAQDLKQDIGITPQTLIEAHQKQLCARGGFWEMRRYFGQFYEMVNEIADDSPDHIICAAASGSIVGAYIGERLASEYGLYIPVDHMIFSRKDHDPLNGYLRPDFNLSGKHILLVEDVVQESRTVHAMLDTLKALNLPVERLSLAALEIDTNVHAQSTLPLFDHVFTFEEE